MCLFQVKNENIPLWYNFKQFSDDEFVKTKHRMQNILQLLNTPFKVTMRMFSLAIVFYYKFKKNI